MKKSILMAILFLAVIRAAAQEIINGWYYLPEPAGNVWGIGYHEPKEGSALSYAGNMKEVSEDDIVVQPGPKTTQRFIKNLNNLVFTSLFQSNKAINYSIFYSQIKQVLLKSEMYKDFDDGNYYVTQALKADSVVIKGTINKDMRGNSADAEKLINTFAGQTTVAFQVVSTLSNKDTTKNTGILSYSKTNKDSFTIVITDPDVFFAVKLSKIENVGNPEKRIEVGKENDIIPNISEDPTDVIYWHYTINRGLDVGIRFYVKDGMGTAETYKHYAGKSYDILSKQSKQILNKPVQFALEGSTVTPNISVGRRKSVDYLITTIGSFVYDPKTNSVKIDTKDNNGKFRTAVFHVEGQYLTWPK